MLDGNAWRRRVRRKVDDPYRGVTAVGDGIGSRIRHRIRIGIRVGPRAWVGVGTHWLLLIWWDEAQSRVQSSGAARVRRWLASRSHVRIRALPTLLATCVTASA